MTETIDEAENLKCLLSSPSQKKFAYPCCILFVIPLCRGTSINNSFRIHSVPDVFHLPLWVHLQTLSLPREADPYGSHQGSLAPGWVWLQKLTSNEREENETGVFPCLPFFAALP